MSTDWVADVNDMHTKFGVRGVVADMDSDKLREFLKFRFNFLQEEKDEGVDALNSNNPDSLEDVVDALIDLCVVAIGTLDALQVNSYEAWNRVLKANMAKEVGIKEGRPNPLGLPDLIKPPGWTAPTHADNVGILTKLIA